MAKLFFIIFATLALQAYSTAAPSAEDLLEAAVEEIPQNEQADPSLNSETYKVPVAASASEDQSLQGQRQKRFYDYFDFDFSPFGPYNPNYVKRDDLRNTAVPGTNDFMYQILRRVQTILNYTRQQALSPPIAHYPVPSFVPIYYIPRGDCDCNTASAPNNGDTQGNDARPTQATITPPAPPADSTSQGVPTEKEPGPAPTDDTNLTTPDFFSRMPDMEGEKEDDLEDGARPISLVPIKPKTPLSRPPPPVEHGSVQASRENGVNKFSSTLAPSPPPVNDALPAQPHLPTNAIPTLCDGAILTCCHKAEVTYDCFMSQGCPNPTSPDNPCDENLILRVIEKFQYYYANRRG